MTRFRCWLRAIIEQLVCRLLVSEQDLIDEALRSDASDHDNPPAPNTVREKSVPVERNVADLEFDLDLELELDRRP